MKPNNSGFSLIEVIIVTAIVGVLFSSGVAVAVVTDFLKTQMGAKHTTDLLSATDNIFNELQREIHAATNVVIVDDSILRVTNKQSELLEYQVDDDQRITRNDTPITLSSLRVTEFGLSDKSVPPAPQLIEITLSIEARVNPNHSYSGTTTISRSFSSQ